ncbi:mucosa-associated lymphoid tissue lymphoma translocation protein 1-like [Thrips palmi]|uniref:Mucosa-associated lymphoid tissue lymphoma translocation protein 1-like n=1 Tax=Thrips palmi TaxID=161013 RepID=A0A6P8YU75_THRPL|nr:mucosa-associated lymphoid tissue lymphoma translocation protein 1-like [Thrips palmi]
MLVKDLSMSQVVRLASELKENDAWRRVAGQFDINTGMDLKDRPTAYDFVTSLIDRHITVGHLQYVLDVLKLEEAAKVLCKPEMLRIVRQPYCEETDGCFWGKNGVLQVKAGERLHLKIEADGCPKPTFQWYCENIPVCSEQEYIIPAFSEEEGVYYCTVHQRMDYGWTNTVTSEDITVKLIDEGQEVPQILSFDCSADELECGEELKLSAKVSAGPQPTFSWWHNAKPLEGFKSNVLRIPHVDKDCKGTYELRVKNRFGENSQKFDIKVKARRPNPSEKKALLISIEDYKDNRLHTPHNDAKALKECLEKYDFHCTLEQDLPANQIEKVVEKFFATLQKDAFVLFYFGGHGMMENRVLYMIGSDADFSPQNFIKYVVSEDSVIDAVQKYQPLMFASILDMCQNSANCDNFPKIESKQTWDCTLFRCYSTSQNRKALEKKGSENSVYVKHLREALLRDKDSTFYDLINKVNRSVINEEEDTGQMPEVRAIRIHDFKLSDAVRSSE